MKKTLLLALAMLGCGVLVGVVLATSGPQQAEAVISQPGTIPASDAENHVGQSVVVEGTVSEVHVAARATFIDIGGYYPDEQFTGVIFPENYDAFPDVTELQGRTIDISGAVRIYRGRPEIILTSANQIRRR